MATIDLHSKPFDNGTIAKLEIFEDYAQAWIPTFVMQKTPVICIFDLFAGTGYDQNGIKGSPIRILDKIKNYIGYIYQNKVKIKLFLNEFEPTKKNQKKFELLKHACFDYLENNKSLKNVVEIIFLNENFESLFPKLIDSIKQYPSLVYLDQNGIKFLEANYLNALEKLNQTDFIYFVSSSYFKRFGTQEEFKKHFEINFDEINKNPYKFIHRVLINQIKAKLPTPTRLKLYPYTIRKGKNIYGIIFGAKHPRAVDKFLTISWNKNSVNGDANFDIDDDTAKPQLDLFTDRKKTKIEKFKENLQAKILAKEIKNNFEALEFVHDEGHIGKHAADCLREMKKKEKIDYDGTSPLITYENVYKIKRRADYKIKK